MSEFFEPDWLDVRILQSPYTKILGVDEVGRGAWAGPVAVGGFIYEPGQPRVAGVKDSKLIKEPKRIELSNSLNQYRFAVKTAPVEIIDNRGITRVIEQLIEDLITELADEQTLILIDGRFVKNFGPRSQQIIKGDMQCYSIAAASILAKVYRDNLMIEYHNTHPQYGFARHKGYGTAAHSAAIKTFGLTQLHRRSFVKNIMSDIIPHTVTTSS